MISLKIIIVALCTIAGGVLSWRLSNYFISRKDRYTNSRYGIFHKKLQWAIFWMLIILIAGIKLVK